MKDSIKNLAKNKYVWMLIFLSLAAGLKAQNKSDKNALPADSLNLFVLPDSTYYLNLSESEKIDTIKAYSTPEEFAKFKKAIDKYNRTINSERNNSENLTRQFFQEGGYNYATVVPLNTGGMQLKIIANSGKNANDAEAQKNDLINNTLMIVWGKLNEATRQ